MAIYRSGQLEGKSQITDKNDNGTEEMQQRSKMLTFKHVSARIGLSRQTIERRITEGSFPSPIRTSVRRVAFFESEIEAWMSTCSRTTTRR